MTFSSIGDIFGDDRGDGLDMAFFFKPRRDSKIFFLVLGDFAEDFSAIFGSSVLGGTTFG